LNFFIIYAQLVDPIIIEQEINFGKKYLSKLQQGGKTLAGAKKNTMRGD
jgi:hypothetical protein